MSPGPPLGEPWGVRLRWFRECVRRESREEFAEALDQLARTLREKVICGERLVARWENGEVRAPRPVYRRLLAALDAPLPSAMAMPWSRSAGLPSVPGDGHDEEVDDVSPVDRRTFLMGSAAAIGGGVMPGLVSPAPRQGGAVPVDPGVVEELRQLRRLLVASDRRAGARHLVAAAAGQVRLVEQLLGETRGALRTDLLHVGALYAEFAGWLTDDVGNLKAAAAWTDRALEWAHEAGDTDLVSYVLMRKAQRSTAAKDAARTVGLAEAAQRPGSRVAPRVLATAAQQQAHGHALAGEAAACERKLDEARQLVDDAPGDAGPDGLGVHCTPSYVEVQRGACWLELGQPRRAVAAFEQALREWPSSYHRERGLHQARLSRALAANREPERACAVAVEALTVADHTGSRRILAELQQLTGGLRPWVDLPQVGELQEALRVRG